MRINVGAGWTVIDGFTPIDRKQGGEAYPLKFNDGSPVPDNSCDEIRASHILEHFGFKDAQAVLQDWIRALKPGGRIRIAVPDIDLLSKVDPDERCFILMGGQQHADDFHRSAWDFERLKAHMEHFGLERIERWQSSEADTASHPCSLNLEGYKPAKTASVRMGAYCTHPRYEAVAARNEIEKALKPLKVDFTCTQGVFWGQCMQRMFQDAVDKKLDWVLSIDSDSIFTTEHVRHLMDVFYRHPEIDALAALQCRRGAPYPLLTTGKGIQDEHHEVDGKPFLVTTAHFGLTLFRVDKLKQVEKPWFVSQPDKDGNWGDDRLDDDIWFWHQWRKAGHSIYVAPSCSIGHLEEMIAVFDQNLQPKHIYMHDWRKMNGMETGK